MFCHKPFAGPFVFKLGNNISSNFVYENVVIEVKQCKVGLIPHALFPCCLWLTSV